MMIITNFPCSTLLFFQQEVGNKRAQVLLCAFYEKNMGLFSPIYCIPSRQIGVYQTITRLSAPMLALMMKFTKKKHLLPPSSSTTLK